MPPDEDQYTFNPLTNEDKQLLLSHGYKPGELLPEEERDLLRDLRADADDADDDSERQSTIPDERDGAD